MQFRISTLRINTPEDKVAMTSGCTLPLGAAGGSTGVGYEMRAVEALLHMASSKQRRVKLLQLAFRGVSCFSSTNFQALSPGFVR